MNKEFSESLLDELYIYTQKELTETLTEEERERYVIIVDLLHENDIDIPFGIEI